MVARRVEADARVIPASDGRGRLAWRRPGRFFVAALTLLLALPACDALGGGNAVVELEDGEVTLEEGASAHEIRLTGVVAAQEVAPQSVEAAPGDALVFVAADALTHSVAFDAGSLEPAQLEFLRSTDQLRSPPLLVEDARWIVSLSDAPAGTYPFRCALHGGSGQVTVGQPRSRGS